MSSNQKVLCVGELLIDFFCTDVNVDLIEGRTFEKQAGGAPANVCAAIVKLGGDAVFSGKVGKDPFGYFLKKTLDDLGIDTSMIVFDENHSTTLAFVSRKEDGERDFVFNRGADAYMTKEDIYEARLDEFSIFHFGSATALLGDPFKSTYLNLMKQAKSTGKLVSFDPNFRDDLWKGSKDSFISIAREGISLADFVKVSLEELDIITGYNDIEEAVQRLHDLGAKVVAVTLGQEGTYLSNRVKSVTVPSIKVKSIDSTGAGDAFVGGILYQLSTENSPIELLSDFDRLKEIVSFSNRVGAIVCTKVGAISALPTLLEVEG
ncbi:carbohydrate kinase [Bacillus luteolus]|uniref:Carbohydrate kinase n=1 Tax=Litchfieldia luteola TaxID=682179 RepID=A0ABR9QJ86_9BACI|nr:carbohydrate kinase [Cytobacillus luteolus]MBE4908476.1 carbohydrate kinase [Cytobacillus luteolus]MBP1941327.1 fructokinase [Cytobacillus luteolus]